MHAMEFESADEALQHIDASGRGRAILCAGKRLVVVGTGTSWHAANHACWFLRAAGVDARPVQGMDAALYGTGAGPGDAVVVLSHRNSKRYTSEAGAAARAAGTTCVIVGGIGSPGVDVETTEQERSAAFTAVGPRRSSIPRWPARSRPCWKRARPTRPPSSR